MKQLNEQYNILGLRADNSLGDIPPPELENYIPDLSNKLFNPRLLGSGNVTAELNYLNALRLSGMPVQAIQKNNLTDGAKSSIFFVQLPISNYSAGVVNWTLTAGDGNNFQCRVGIMSFAIINQAGSITIATSTAAGTVAVSTGTLLGDWNLTAGTNQVTFKFTPDSSLTPDDITLNSVVHYLVSGDINPI